MKSLKGFVVALLLAVSIVFVFPKPTQAFGYYSKSDFCYLYWFQGGFHTANGILFEYEESFYDYVVDQWTQFELDWLFTYEELTSQFHDDSLYSFIDYIYTGHCSTGW